MKTPAAAATAGTIETSSWSAMAVAKLVRALDAGIDRVDDADEDARAAGRVFADEAEHAAGVGLTRELDVEAAGGQAQEAGEELRVVDVETVRRVLVAAGAGVDP